jgi:Zn-dependent protease with chaperone function
VPRAGSKQLKITFTKDQLKARDLHWTVAHELAHLAAPPAVARETRRRSLAWALAHFAVGALVVLKFQSESYELALGLILLGTLGLEICALFSLFAGRRREEYRADAVATRLVGPKVSVDFLKHPDFVDGRLQRLEARLEYWADEQIDRRTLIGRLLYLFSSHPTLSERARALSQVKPETL